MFELHNQLKKDTILVKDLKLCQVLLIKNALYPWFVLVPRKPDLVEIIDLSKDDQILLMEEISLVSQQIKENFKADKLNIAALGNMVPQLHIHIIARFRSDETFPNPVWVSSKMAEYEEEEIQRIIEIMK
ncbi:MAG: diadenosine tetraphosphate (Ap4A) HIT family hydrolase [Rickettsiales bacterium]|jgi:diadenosine tetraphosphate (Ap4A) HIT family hydrolase